MTAKILLIGNTTPRIESRLAEDFETIHAANINDMEAFVAGEGEAIEGIAAYSGSAMSASLIENLPNLKIISCFGVGYDAVPLDAALSRNIVVTHTPNVLNKDVANCAIMLMLATSRDLVRDYRWVTSGNWVGSGSPPLSRSIEGAKVGIVGMGRIGEEIARKLSMFECDIAYHSRTQKTGLAYTYYGNLKQMAEAVSYMVVIVPGGPATQKMIDREIIDALGPHGTLINIARGTVVDEPELVLALQEKRLGWAALDVFENEPQVPEALFSMENVTLLPHSGSATLETRQAMGDLTVDNLISFFHTGKAISPVPECQN